MQPDMSRGVETELPQARYSYGGDEFALILSETGAAGAAVVAERLRRIYAEAAGG